MAEEFERAEELKSVLPLVRHAFVDEYGDPMAKVRVVGGGQVGTERFDVSLWDPRLNARMVYTELGPYDGQKLGTPCDDLM